MIIESVRNFISEPEMDEMTEVIGTVDNLPFQYFLTGTHTLEQAQTLVPVEEVTKLAYERGAVDFRNKIVLANDIQIGSPKPPKTKKEAEDTVKKFKKNMDDGNIKSIGEAVQALVYLYLNK